MKKILALLLAVVMVLGMVACASKTEAPAETTTTEPAAETTTEETKTEEPAKEEETATEEQPTEAEGVIKKVALVTDVGTIDDESFLPGDLAGRQGVLRSQRHRAPPDQALSPRD